MARWKTTNLKGTRISVRGRGSNSFPPTAFAPVARTREVVTPSEICNIFHIIRNPNPVTFWPFLNTVLYLNCIMRRDEVWLLSLVLTQVPAHKIGDSFPQNNPIMHFVMTSDLPSLQRIFKMANCRCFVPVLRSLITHPLIFVGFYSTATKTSWSKHCRVTRVMTVRLATMLK